MSAIMRNHAFVLAGLALASAFSQTSGGVRENHRRPKDSRLEALATTFLSLTPIAALRSSTTQAQPPVAVRPRIAKMEATASLDRRSELTRVGKLVAEWCVASDRSEATIAVSGGTSIPEILRDLWKLIREFSREKGKIGRQRIVAFPMWKEGHDKFPLFEAFFQHIAECSELSEILSATMLVNARHPNMQVDGEPNRPPCIVILLRSFAQPDFEDLGDDDPFAVLPDTMMDGSSLEVASDKEVLAQTHNFVQGIIVDMKVCPFSSTVEKAGVPIGGVTYPISHASTAEEVYQNFWEQVLLLQSTDQHDVATILLITPRFALYSPGAYDMLSDTLNSALTDLGVEREIQLVFFHPEFAFRDGKNRLGDEGAANYARRSPYPMINLLRTPQVRDAQKGVPTGQVYITNEENLKSVGQSELQQMLETRDWKAVHGKKFVKHSEHVWGIKDARAKLN